MKFIKNIWNWFLYKDGHLDWLKHEILGTLVFLISCGIIKYFKQDNFLVLTVGWFACFIVASGREIYDHIYKGKKEHAWDILWTIKTPSIIILTLILNHILMEIIKAL